MRQIGRTTKMLKETLKEVLTGENKKVVVIAHTQEYAKNLMYKFIEENCDGVKFTFNPNVGGCLHFDNGNVLYFRSKDFLNKPSYKFQKWKTFQDHYVAEQHVEKYRRMLEEDLKGPNKTL